MISAAMVCSLALVAPSEPTLLYLSTGDPRVGSQLVTYSSQGHHSVGVSQPESAGTLTGAIRPDGKLLAFISGSTLWTAPVSRRAATLGGVKRPLRAGVAWQSNGAWTGAIRAASNAHGPLSWSADGRTLLFNRPPRGSGSGAIVKLAVSELGAATSEQRILLGEDAERDIWAKFSPSGTKIVFTRFINRKGDQLMTMNPDGRELYELPADNGLWNYGSWNHDATRLVAVRGFSALTPGTPGIYTMDARGAAVQMVPGTSSVDMAPFFSPSGTEVIFARSIRSGSFEQKDLYLASLEKGDAPRPFLETAGITEVPLQWINLKR